MRRKGPGAHGPGAMAGVVTGDRSKDRRQELAGDDDAGRRKRAQATGAGVGTGDGSWRRELAGGGGGDGAGRCKWGEAGRERWRGTRSGRTRKEAD